MTREEKRKMKHERRMERRREREQRRMEKARRKEQENKVEKADHELGPLGTLLKNIIVANTFVD